MDDSTGPKCISQQEVLWNALGALSAENEVNVTVCLSPSSLVPWPVAELGVPGSEQSSQSVHPRKSWNLTSKRLPLDLKRVRIRSIFLLPGFIPTSQLENDGLGGSHPENRPKK